MLSLEEVRALEKGNVVNCVIDGIKTQIVCADNTKDLMTILDLEDEKECGECRHCEECESIFDAGTGWCFNKKSEWYLRRVSLSGYKCNEFEKKNKDAAQKISTNILRE